MRCQAPPHRYSRYPLHRSAFLLVLLCGAFFCGCSGASGDDDGSPTPGTGTPEPGASPTPTVAPSPPEESSPTPGGTPGSQVDADRDGYTADVDCDDRDSHVHPAAGETCGDGEDNDCDGAIDEHLLTWYRDSDGDRHGDPGSSLAACVAPPGYVSDPGAASAEQPTRFDCDDARAETYPGAAELCDEADNDCDGGVDEGVTRDWYLDRDDDGFGTTAMAGCVPPDGYVAARGDCDDTDASVHPGAVDPAGDGRDQDCGGQDGAQPSVGLTESTFTSIQAAIDAAESGSSVWVGPGTWLEHDLTFRGRALTLSTTHGPAETIVDAQGQGRCFVFDGGEVATTVLDGFTLTGGAAVEGAGIFTRHASPILQNLVLSRNTALGDGGGFYFSSGAPVLRDSRVESNVAAANIGGGGFIDGLSTGRIERVRFSANKSKYQGGGLAVLYSSTHVDESLFDSNSGTEGGGVYLVGATAILRRSTMWGNSAGYGAGLAIVGGSPLIEDSDIVENRGQGVWLSGSAANLTRVRVLSNTSSAFGAGVYVAGGAPSLSATLIAGNYSGSGGGIYLDDASPSLEHCTVVGNGAWNDVGGIYLHGSASLPSIRSSIVAWNGGYALYSDTPAAAADQAEGIRWNTIFSPVYAAHNLPGLDPSNLLERPGFMAWIHDGDIRNDDYHLLPGAAQVGSGDPSSRDPDGSSADMGAYGGLNADSSFYADEDGDGMYDAWEHQHGLDPARDDSALDPDVDGLVNGEELEAGTDPARDDCDGDGYADGAERLAGASPLDWYSQPGIEGVHTARVPEDFPRVGDALAAVVREGVIDVGPGVWVQGLHVRGVVLTLFGRAGTKATRLEATRSSVFTAEDSRVILRDLTVSDGSAKYGSGLALFRSSSALERLDLCYNESPDYADGGGAYIHYGETTIRDSAVFSNTVDEYGVGDGGGLAVYNAFATVLRCRFEDNRSSRGGGIHGWAANVVVEDSIFRNLDADSGTAFYMGGTALTVRGSVVEDNTGGSTVLLSQTTTILSHCRIARNLAYDGNIVTVRDATLTIDHCIVEQNEAPQGAALEIGWGRLSLDASVVVGNTGDEWEGAGLYIYSSPATIRSSILAHNSPQNLRGKATVSYSDLYPGAGSWVVCEAGCLEVDPGFLSYSRGLPADYHLGLESPLIDQGDPAVLDADGSPADMGAFSGPGGATWDLDLDGRYNWFWPGTVNDAPSGFEPAGWDCDDLDPAVSKACP